MAKKFERNLDAATDSTLIEPNWDGILNCVGNIRSGDVTPKAALASIQKRIHSENPHTAIHALLTLEACVKNCGASFHKEIAAKSFMEDMRNLAIEGPSEPIRQKVLELIQCWSAAFTDRREYQIVVDTHKLMKFAGVEFPSLREADAMFRSESAPDWIDGEVCFRCRTQFGMITRKHHCRACGQVFCDRCSCNQMVLPDFGIEKLVRVCNTCYKKRSRSSPETVQKKNNNVDSKQFDKTPEDKDRKHLHDAELDEKENEQLQLAIELSRREAEQQNQEMQKQRELLSLYNGTEASADLSSVHSFCGNTISTSSASTTALNGHGIPPIYKNEAFNYNSSGYDRAPGKSISEENVVDPELARYLDKDYWNQRRTELDTKDVDLKASAPPPSELSYSGSASTMPTPLPIRASIMNCDSSTTINQTPEDEDEVNETAKFCQGLEQQVTVMDNRIRSNLNRGRSIINDTAVQAQFVQLAETHAEILRRMAGLDDKREFYEGLQDRVAHISEARLAINALREDHQQQKREREIAEQQARQRQMQEMLEIMRNKKQEMLIYQRHVAYKKFQGGHDMQVHNPQPVAVDPHQVYQMSMSQAPYSLQQPEYAMRNTVDSVAPMSTVTQEAYTMGQTGIPPIPTAAGYQSYMTTVPPSTAAQQQPMISTAQQNSAFHVYDQNAAYWNAQNQQIYRNGQNAAPLQYVTVPDQNMPPATPVAQYQQMGNVSHHQVVPQYPVQDVNGVAQYQYAPPPQQEPEPEPKKVEEEPLLIALD